MPASSEQPCACGCRDCKHRFDWPSGTPPGPAARSATPPRKQPQSQAAARVVGGSRAAGRMASSASGRRTAGSPVRGSRSARGGATQSQGARGGAAGSAKKRSAGPAPQAACSRLRSRADSHEDCGCVVCLCSVCGVCAGVSTRSGRQKLRRSFETPMKPRLSE